AEAAVGASAAALAISHARTSLVPLRIDSLLPFFVWRNRSRPLDPLRTLIHMNMDIVSFRWPGQSAIAPHRRRDGRPESRSATNRGSCLWLYQSEFGFDPGHEVRVAGGRRWAQCAEIDELFTPTCKALDCGAQLCSKSCI